MIGGRTRSLVAGQRRSTSIVAHRPWPLPRGPWVMGQTWEDLVFLHWRVSADALRRVVPPQLPIDTFDGHAWLGITPFVLRGLRLRGTPPLPLVSTFPELNVRTYATLDRKPGIYFLSLDAASPLAVAGARLLYRLPYHRATIEARRVGGRVQYRRTRQAGRSAPAELEAEYGPMGPVFHARAGSLEHWLTERYCLYTLDERLEPRRADIHHPPWPLQDAQVELRRNSMALSVGIELRGGPLAHFARRQDVVIWPLRRHG